MRAATWREINSSFVDGMAERAAQAVTGVPASPRFERPDHTTLTTSDAWETDIEKQGHDPTRQDLLVERITLPNGIASRLRLDRRNDVCVVRRHVRYIDGKPAIISDDYFDERIVSFNTRSQHDQNCQQAATISPDDPQAREPSWAGEWCRAAARRPALRAKDRYYRDLRARLLLRLRGAFADRLVSRRGRVARAIRAVASPPIIVPTPANPVPTADTATHG